MRVLRWTRDLYYEIARRHDRKRWELEVDLDAVNKQIEVLEEKRDALEMRINKHRFRCYQLREQARVA